jgi:hypothetical protein
VQHPCGSPLGGLPSAFERERDETSPPSISASGNCCCRAAGRLAHRVGADLSDAAGTLDRVVHCRRTKRHRGTHHWTGSVEHIKAGTLRALGVTAGKRAAAIPDVPTIAETVPGYEAVVWYGIVAPKGTPPEIVDTLNTGVNAVLADPKLEARLVQLGGVPMPMTPAQFGKLIADETEKWAKVVKFSGAKPD